MGKNIKEKYLDLRIRNHYLKKGIVSKNEIDSHLKNLPNDENNFELTTFDDDDLGIAEANKNFDFSESETNEKN